MDEAFRWRAAPHRGPVFLDVSLEALYDRGPEAGAACCCLRRPRPGPDPGRISQVAAVLGAEPSGRSWSRLGRLDGRRGVRGPAGRRRCGSRSSPTARAAASSRLGHPLLVTRARSTALRRRDLVLVAGAPLDFRLGYGQFGSQGDFGCRLRVVRARGRFPGPARGALPALAGAARPVISARSSPGWPPSSPRPRACVVADEARQAARGRPDRLARLAGGGAGPRSPRTPALLASDARSHPPDADLR